MFYIRHALALIYTALFILLICGLNMTLFESPPFQVKNLAGSRLVRLTVPGLMDVSVNNAIPGADFEAGIKFTMWDVTIDAQVNISYYGYDPQNVHQRYTVEDLPCKEFRTTMRTAQVFGVLSVFTSFFCLVLIISNFFSRLFLPVLWVMIWVNIACVSSACSMLLKMLCEPSCYGKNELMPPFVSLAVPEGGFAVYLICMFSYLLTSIMCVFL